MNSPTRIPFIDLAPEIAALRYEIDCAIKRVLDSGHLIHGEELAAFEAEFADYHGASHAVGVASGLAALTLMLRTYDIGPGDEVIVPANTYIATWLAVSQVGALPVPVEPDPYTRNIDISRLDERLTGRTRAVLAVHLYGMPCDMDALRDFCRCQGLYLLVDAAQSCGAEWNGSRNACLGDAAAFSFYPTKNLGSLGEAGAVVTIDPERCEIIKLLRNYGMKNRYQHVFKGENARLEELHAAVLRVKLRHLEAANTRRRELAELYKNLFNGVEEVAFQKSPYKATPVWHLFTVTVPQRDLVSASLAEQGIETAVHYPVPPHLSGAYKDEMTGCPELPITEELSKSLLSLPLYPALNDNIIHQIAKAVISAAVEQKGSTRE